MAGAVVWAGESEVLEELMLGGECECLDGVAELCWQDKKLAFGVVGHGECCVHGG